MRNAVWVVVRAATPRSKRSFIVIAAVAIINAAFIVMSTVSVQHGTASPELDLYPPWDIPEGHGFKLLSMDCVFACLLGHRPGMRGRGRVEVVNCSEADASESWDVQIQALPLVTKLPLTKDPSYCLGVVGHELGTDLCESNSSVVEWLWSLASGSFLLVHVATNTCLMRDGGHEDIPGRAVMRTCEDVLLEKQETDADSRVLAVRPFMWLPAAFPQLVPEHELPLRAAGSELVGTSGHAVKLRGTNWYGAHMEQYVNNGLDTLTVHEIARAMLNLGMNSVRMNFGTQQVVVDPVVDERLLQANPQLKGKTSMTVFDECIRVLTNYGLLIILNNHVTINSWCCNNMTDDNAFWFNARWPEGLWFEVLTNVSRRYKANSRVVGLDLRNEVRPDLRDTGAYWLVWWGPIWGQRGLAVDWQEAAQEGAKAVWQGDPNALVFVEGTWGIDLSTVMQKPLVFGQDCMHAQVVFSVHDYGQFSTWFRILRAIDDASLQGFVQRVLAFARLVFAPRRGAVEDTYTEFAENRDTIWGYLVRGELAPVWVGEFGGHGVDSERWITSFARYAYDLDLSWCYWSIDGYKFKRFSHGEKDQPEDFGLLTADYRGVHNGRVLLRLASMLVMSGVQNRTKGKRGHDRECTFDPGLNSVGATRGLHGVSTLQEIVGLYVIRPLCFMSVVLMCCSCFCCCSRRSNVDEHTVYGMLGGETQFESVQPSLRMRGCARDVEAGGSR